MPGTDDLMAGYSNSIGGLMAGHNSMVSGLMANYNAGGGSGGGFMAGPAFTPGPGVSYGPGPMNSGGSGGGMPGMFGMESDDPETQRKLLIKRRLKSGKMDGKTPGMPDLPFGDGFQMPNMGGLMQQQPMQPMGQEFEQGGDAPSQPPRRKIRGYSNPAARSTKVPFGGAFANGGIAPAGKVSLVGERGPELIMPTGPTKVVPMRPDPRNPALMRPATDFNPVNGRYSEFDGKSRTDYFGGAMQPGKQGRVYDELRTAAVGKPMGPDARSFSHPQGQNFAGPAAPPRSIDAAFSQPTAAPQGSDGRLVASSNGGVKWQQGSGPGFGPPPQSRAPTMRPIDAAFTDNSLSGRASARDGAVRTGSLSERGATPVGSGRMTPERRLKMLSRRAWTRGDDSAVAGLTQAASSIEQRGIDRAFQAGQQGAQQNFMRERDATNFQQGMQMWNLDRSFQLDAEGRRNQAALDAEGRRNQRGDAEWTRSRDAELEDRKNSAIDAPFTMMDPSGKFVIPGVKTRGGDFKPMGGAYPVKEANAGPTPAEVNQMRQDADTRGYDMVQLPSGEWKLQRKLQPADGGSETTVYDADGKATQRTVRTPKGGSTSSKGTGYW